MKKTNYFGFILFFMLFCNSINSQTLQDNFPVTNGEVKAFAQYNNTTYIGGTFDYIGPNTGRGVLIDPITGNYDPSFPKINGEVVACISDGDGGWYIGGIFTKVGNEYRNRVAHIKNDMTVGNWNPNVHWADGSSNSRVYSITKDGNKIYIGGFFDSVGDSSRQLLACIDSATGIATSFNVNMAIANPNNGVYGIAVRDTIVFIGGNFGGLNIPAVSRSGLASVSSNTGLVTDWYTTVSGGYAPSPYFASVVYGLNLYNDTTLYVWGNFQSIDANTRWGLAAVKPDGFGSGGYLYDWRPNNLGPSSQYFRPIRSIAISGDTVFVGGDFLRFGTNTTIRNRLAACSRTSSTFFAWNPNVDNGLGTSGTATYQHRINSLIVINDIVYVGGLFSTISGQERKNMAAISMSGSLLSWNPNPNTIGSGNLANSVNVLFNQGNNFFAGGKFSSINGVKRNYLASFDATNGNIFPWDPNISGFSISTLLVHNSNLFVGGGFSSIGGVSINNLVKVDVNTGNVDPTWIINPNLQVDGALGVHNDTLYVSGTFNQIGDSSGSQYSRYRNASIDIATGQVTSWNPNANNSFDSFAFLDSLIFVCGNFNNIGNSARSFLGCVDSRTGIATSWNPNPNGVVTDIELIGQNIYASGEFTQIGATLKNYLAVIDKETGSALSWDANLGPASLYSIAASGSQLYFGGSFQSVGVSARQNLASVNISDGSVTNWNPNANGVVNEIFLDYNNQKIYLGGSFETINNDPATFLAVVDNPDDPLPVELTTFTANNLTNGIELHWQTATEVNNYGFDVEKKAPLNLPQGETYGDWETIGFVEGNGNSNSPKEYSFIDEDIQNQPNGKYYYRLKQIDTDGGYSYSSTIEIDWTNGITDVNDDSNLPKEFSLSQNYPNPFNPTTKIKYTIPIVGTQNPVSVKLKIYNIMGQEIATLVNEVKSPGSYEVEFNGKGLSSGMSAKGGYASGVYFYKIEAGSFVNVKKMILLK